MKLSIIVPAYNEELRIGKTIESILQYLLKKDWDYEILVVDDGSSDQTVEVVKKAFGDCGIHKKIIQNERNRGKGYSVKRGMLEATGDFLLFTDADLSTPISDVEMMITALNQGADVAIGSRDLSDSQVEIHQNFLRELMGKVFNRLARLLTFKGIHDSQCGFKCFRHNAAKEIFSLQKIDGFSFDVEIVYLAQRLGYQVREVPVVWRNSPASRVNVLSDPLKMFIDLFRIRLIHLKDVRSNACNR